MKRLALLLLLASPVFAQSPAPSSTGNITAAGANCLTTNACINLTLIPNTGGVAVTVTGTWVATLAVEQSADNGVTWSSAGTAISSNGLTTYTVVAMTNFRVRASAYTSGTAIIVINSGATPGSAAGTINGVVIGGTPTVGQVPTATGAATGTWQTPAGGTSAFSAITTGTNAAALHVGTGGTLDATGSGTIHATTSDNVAGTATNPASLSNSSGYTLYVSAGTIYAKNNITGTVDFSGADAAIVINSALGQMTAGGTLFFKRGTYTFSSATQEIVAPYTAIWYCVGVPSTNTVSWPQFNFEGEASNLGINIGIDTVTPTDTPTGVIFNVTTAAETAAGAAVLDAFRIRPNTNNTPGLYWNTQAYFKNISIQFPNNQRGNEVAIDALEGTYLSLENVSADFLAVPTLASVAGNTAFVSPSTPSYGTYWLNVFAAGWETGFEVDTDHSQLINTYAFHDTNGYYFGRNVGRANSAILHGSTWIHPQVYDCINGVRIGTHASLSGQLMIDQLDLEYILTGNWTYVYGMGEDTPGTTGGIVTWDSILTNSGVGSLLTPWKTGGSGKNFLTSSTQSNSVNGSGFGQSRQISTIGTDMQIGQAGDTNGGSGLMLMNRAGFAGALVNNYGLPLADLGLSGTCKIATIAIAANVLTVTCANSVAVAWQSGTAITFSGLTTNTFLNAQVVTLTSGSGSNMVGPFTHANVSGPDTGVGTIAANIRFESRTGSLQDATNTLHGEVQITDPNDNATSVPFMATGAGATVIKSLKLISPLYNTTTNCSSSAAPAVCAAASAGTVVVAAAGTTVTVNTTAVTANSEIYLQEDSSLGTKLSVTCNTTPATALTVTARTAATSFVITTNAPTTNPRCISYRIIN